MDSLGAYKSSDDEESESLGVESFNSAESSSIIAKLQERYPVDSAPKVPVKVNFNWVLAPCGYQ